MPTQGEALRTTSLQAPAPSKAPKLHRPLLGDVSGAFGDIGTLMPLAVALISINGLSPHAVLGLAGVVYIAAGAWFGIPVPVQPLKAASAIAIARGFPAPVISATALWMGAVLLVLAASGAAARLDILFPLPIVRGLQLGVGLLLLKSASGMLSPSAQDVLLAGGALLFLALFSRRTPTALVLAVVGFAWAALHSQDAAVGWHPPVLAPRVPTAGEMATALTALTIPQLPLTLGNAVVATCDAAAKYFPEATGKVTPRRICASLALANLTAGSLGGMPMCHGSGGLTAHYRLGARTWRSNAIIGTLLLAAAVALGGDAVPLFKAFPKPLLSALLAYVGIQHSLLARGLSGTAALTAVVVGAAGAVTGNLLIGMVAGTVVHWLGVSAKRRAR